MTCCEQIVPQGADKFHLGPTLKKLTYGLARTMRREHKCLLKGNKRFVTQSEKSPEEEEVTWSWRGLGSWRALWRGDIDTESERMHSVWAYGGRRRASLVAQG